MTLMPAPPPPSMARLLLVAPANAEDAAAVAALLVPYAPTVLAALPGAPAEARVALAAHLGLSCEALVGDAAHIEVLDALAAQEQGRSIVVLVPAEVIPLAVARALGVPRESAVRFAIPSRAVSVLERDGEGRWAVARVNEGAYPPHS